MPAPTTDQPLKHLGGLTPQQFMRRHWQKRPLFVKAAFREVFQAELPIDQAEFLSAAQEEAVPSRLVRGSPSAGGSLRLSHGPFKPRQIPSLKTPEWTILIQQLNTLFTKADAFLDHFRFIPEGRHDDLMGSLASDAGGIGAHVDSYDVFLIQAAGCRQWEIAQTFDDALLPDLPLKVLANFEAEETFLCEPGDLLYLPPGVAHRGIAMGSGCMTYSVGFRAPAIKELADDAFGQHLDSLADAPWSDPWLGASDGGGVLPDRLVQEMARAAEQCLPSREALSVAVVVALSRPHPSIWPAPAKEQSDRQFQTTLRRSKGIVLAPGARLLIWREIVACNGERLHLPDEERTPMLARLEQLAKQRRLGAAEYQPVIENPEWARLFKDCYDLGALIVL